MSQKQWMRIRTTGDAPIHSRDISCEANGCRPVVVIDPEDREQRDELVRAISQRLVNQGVPFDILNGAVTSALCSLVTDPKPEEPTGLFARVLDADGQQWARVCEHVNGCNSWAPVEMDGFGSVSGVKANGVSRVDWGQVTAVRVLSEGVQAGESA